MYFTAKVVEVLGNRKAIDLMYETEMIEESGGLKVLVSIGHTPYHNSSHKIDRGV